MTQFGPDYVRAIAPYQAGKPIAEVAREFGLDEAAIVKLASNENPFGIPQSSVAAMQATAADLGRYPDANGFELKAALVARYDVPAAWATSSMPNCRAASPRTRCRGPCSGRAFR